MRQYLYLLFLVILLWGCKKNEVVIPNETNTSLTINWKHPEYGNSSLKDNARVYLYDSEKEYKNPVGKAILSKSLADIYPPNGGTITPVDSASFDHLQPIQYWVKIFNAYNHERLIEYNQDSSFTFQDPLVENTSTTVTIPTKRIYVNSYTIQKIEIYDIPAGINAGIGQKVSLKVYEAYPFGYAAEDVVLDSKILTVNNSIITYEPTNATINSFKSWWSDPAYYIILSNVGSTQEEYYEINIFELLNSNAHFGNEYTKLNDRNEIKYKLYVTWDFKETI
jgi:hypothetical protein